MQWACLLLPQLAMDGVLRRLEAPDDAAIALVEGPAQRRVLHSVTPAARALGLRPGLSLAAAQALSARFKAIDHDAAEIMVELLRKKSFSAITAEVPEKPGVFRVLVGPVAEADVAKIRTDLQNASFPGKDAIKRTF